MHAAAKPWKRLVSCSARDRTVAPGVASGATAHAKRNEEEDDEETAKFLSQPRGNVPGRKGGQVLSMPEVDLLPTEEERAAPTRSGFIAVVGATNAGKSTLINRLVGAKVSIVSPKVQTTRRRILGICMVGEEIGRDADGEAVRASQLVFMDTPGIFIHDDNKRLERAMVSAAWSAADEAEVVLFLVDAQAFCGALADERGGPDGQASPEAAPADEELPPLSFDEPAAAAAGASAGRGASQGKRGGRRGGGGREAREERRQAESAETVRQIAERLRASGRRAVLCVNKTDLLPTDQARREAVAAIREALDPEGHMFTDAFHVSAVTGAGCKRLLEFLGQRVPEGPFLFPPEQLSDLPERLLAAEVTREQLYHLLHEELPYESTVESERWVNRPDGSAVIHQVIYVARATQRSIVLGKNGSMIKQIGSRARQELSRDLGRPVHLFLHVAVREDWLDDPRRYREMGLSFKV
eukprot:tig00001154_g7285.t1